MTDHTTNTPAPAQEALLTDDEINEICEWPSSNTTMRAENDRALARATEQALLSKLRAPKPLGDSCHHCGWMDWVSQDGKAYCQACGKPHGSVPAEGLPNLPELLRENADLDEAEGGNAQVCALERDAADEIERLRREVSKLRAPVADERAALPEEAYAALQYVEGSLAAIANRQVVMGDVIERVDTIAAAAKRAKAALSRLQNVAHHFDAALASAPVAGEAVGRIVLFGGELKEVSWTAGKMPPPGTVLFAAPQASEAQCSCPSGDGSLRHPCAVHGGNHFRDATKMVGVSEAVRSYTLDEVFGPLEALQIARTALMEIADLPDVEADQRGVIVNQALTKIDKLTAAALSAQPGARKEQSDA
jgi:HAMP domain-containing protein